MFKFENGIKIKTKILMTRNETNGDHTSSHSHVFVVPLRGPELLPD